MMMMVIMIMGMRHLQLPLTQKRVGIMLLNDLEER